MLTFHTINESLHDCITALKQGHLVAFPTETVYGLGGDACNRQAILRIFSAKDRPSFNPLIVHLSSPEQVGDYAETPETFKRLSKIFSPGPLTYILKRKPACPVSEFVSAGMDTLAVRIPSHPVAQTLLKSYGGPIAAPSANLSEHISPTAAEHVYKNFKDRTEPKIILDGGPCQEGLESTVIDLTQPEPTLLRLGTVTQAFLEDVLGRRVLPPPRTEKISSPGQMRRHYSPSLPLRINAHTPKPDEAFIAFGPTNIQQNVFQLSPTCNLAEAATNLYKMLYLADQPTLYKGIAIMAVPNIGLGAAINDRLLRAAKKKDT